MREMLQLMVQLVVLGLIFLAAVPLAAVLLFGQLGQAEGPDLQLPFRDRVNTPDTITVWLEDRNRAVKVDFEGYVCRVVASEMPATFEEEALKAQSVAARTFAMVKIEKYKEKKQTMIIIVILKNVFTIFFLFSRDFSSSISF